MNKFQQNLKYITPSNFSNQKFMGDCVDILTETISEYQPYPNNNLALNDEQKVIKREAFLQSYLNDIFSSLSSALLNPVVLERLKKLNPNHKYTLADLVAFINSEFLIVGKELKLRKGQVRNIELIYRSIINSQIQPGMSEDSFEFSDIDEFDETKKTPFQFYIRGDMAAELYEATVKKISHPLGFAFDFSKQVVIPNIEELITDLEDDLLVEAVGTIIWKEFIDFGEYILDDIILEQPPKKEEPMELLDDMFRDDDFTITSSDISDIGGYQLVDSISMQHLSDDKDEDSTI